MKNKIIPSGIRFIVLCTVFSGVACSTARYTRSPDYSSKDLLRFACSVGEKVRSAQGRIFVKVNSKDDSGQFPAQVRVDDQGMLKLEVSNPLGGPVAWVTVSQGHYEVTDFRAGKPTKESGDKYWSGVPLEWAPSLLLGRVPCPHLEDSLRFEAGKEGELIVTAPKAAQKPEERFVFRFSQWNSSPWPSALQWSQVEVPGSRVDFTFESPEKETGSPEKWDAQSSRGQVKIKWRSREVTRD
jgi:hypothetical protein